MPSFLTFGKGEDGAFYLVEDGEQVSRPITYSYTALRALHRLATARGVIGVPNTRAVTIYNVEDDAPDLGRFEGSGSRVISEALEEILGISGYDEDTGDVQETGAYCTLVLVGEPDSTFNEPDNPCELLDIFPARAYITEENEQGFFSWEAFDTEKQARAKWDEILDRMSEAYGPQEDDATLFPSGYLGSKTSAAFGPDLLGEFDSEDEAEQAIRAAMIEHNFYPNVWRISDHGNAHLDRDFAVPETSN